MQVFATLPKSRRQLLVVLALSVSAILGGCSHGRADQKLTGPAAAVQTTTYNGRGVVKATDPKRPSIELDHEEIKGLMPAMTMEFYVKDKAMLDGLRAGDRVEFTIENGVGGLKITSLKKPEVVPALKPISRLTTAGWLTMVWEPGSIPVS